MYLLTSMTNAEPETRWILVCWVAKFGDQIVQGDNPELLEIFGVSKKSLDAALSYLVTERYLVKTINHIQIPKRTRSSRRFNYYASDECLYYWRDFCYPYPWDREFDTLLLRDLGTRKNKQGNFVQLTPRMRLTMLFLYRYADEAGYVVIREPGWVQQTLGFTETGFANTIEKLVDIGEVKSANSKGNCELFKKGVNQILRISRQQFTRRTIQVGIDADGSSFVPRLVSDLLILCSGKKRDFNEISKRHNLTSLLFKDLTLATQNKKFLVALYHFCLRTLFALIPLHAEDRTVTGSKTLRAKIVEKLFEGIDGEHVLKEMLISLPHNYEFDDIERKPDYLKFWMLNEIIIDLENTITHLSLRWANFQQYFKRPIQLVGWQPKQRMSVIFPDGFTPQIKNICVGLLLEVLVVDHQPSSDFLLLEESVIEVHRK